MKGCFEESDRERMVCDPDELGERAPEVLGGVTGQDELEEDEGPAQGQIPLEVVVTVPEFEVDQPIAGADLDDVAIVAVQGLDGARAWRWDFDERLVSFHLRQGLVFLDDLTRLDSPLDKFSFMYTFPEIGKKEV